MNHPMRVSPRSRQVSEEAQGLDLAFAHCISLEQSGKARDQRRIMNSTTTGINEEPVQDRGSMVSDDSDSGENPLLTLMDAAASLLDKSKSQTTEQPEKDCTPKEIVVIESSKVIRGTKEDLFNVDAKKTTFPEQLMEILDDETNNDCLRWMPSGDAFTIIDHRRFKLDRMPKLFKIQNMSSFVRKLTRWGFQRVHEKATRNSDIFRHKFFKRGRRDLAKRIRCVTRSVSIPAEVMEHSTGLPYNTAAAVQQQLRLDAERERILRRQSLSAVSILDSRDLAYQQSPFPSQLDLPPLSRRESLLLQEERSRLGLCTPPSPPALIGDHYYRPHRRLSTSPLLEDMTSQVVSAAIETLQRDGIPYRRSGSILGNHSTSSYSSAHLDDILERRRSISSHYPLDSEIRGRLWQHPYMR